ncbi:sugar transporter [Bacteroidia bacterium]|nr:sugar transporter [Bacteroidia bacterium]GHT51168.1 sugar transporter [Bacteroidia bacterium]
MSQENNDQSIDNLFGRQAPASSFDFATLLSKILKYWVLFVVFFIIALALAYLKNRSWTPTYKIATTILIEDSRSALRNDFTSGYSSMGYSNRTFNNQMIMYNSYDFIANTVDRLNLTTEIYEKQRFKNIVIYKDAQIRIDSHYVADMAYGLEFRIRGVNEDMFEISFIGNDQIPAFRQQGKYGVPIQHVLFFAEIQKTDLFVNAQYDLYFHFFSKSNLISLYGDRLSSRLLMEGASVIEIALTSKVAQRDLDFLNLLNEQFFQENLERKNETAERSILFIDRQIAILRDSIDSSEAKLNSYQLSSGLYSQDQSASRSKVLEELEQKKNDIRLRKEYLSYLSTYLNNPNNELLTDPSAFQISNPQLSLYINQYNTLALEMRSLGASSPIYTKSINTMEDLRGSIRAAIKAMNSIIALEEKDNNQRYAKARAELANLPQQERELLTHERDFKINDTYYTYLLQRRTESQIQKASNAPDNLIIDKPRVIGVVNGGEQRRTYMIYVLIGLLIPFIFVACKEFLFKFNIQSREEIEKITTIPLLGTIEKSKKKELIAVKAHPRSSFAEGFRNLRARMEYMVKREGSTSILVTSTEPQDGKTFIAINLASTYQMGGKKVILVDCDLRRPALSKSLDLDNNKGLSNCLIGQISLDEAIVPLEQGFDILPAGVIPPNPSELIRTPQAREIIQALIKKYDYVVLDCSPVGLVSDAHFLSRLVDIVLYVVRDEKTNKDFFKYTIKELQDDGITNIALVYNDVDAKISRYGKGYYYLKHDSYYHNG